MGWREGEGGRREGKRERGGREMGWREGEGGGRERGGGRWSGGRGREGEEREGEGGRWGGGRGREGKRERGKEEGDGMEGVLVLSITQKSGHVRTVMCKI